MVSVARYCIKYINDHPEIIEQTLKKVHYFKEGIKKIGLTYGGHKDSAVVPVYVRCEAIGKFMIEELLRRGVMVIGIAFPVVEVGQARARVIINRTHTMEQIDRALKIVSEVATDLGYYDYVKELDKGIDPFQSLVYKFGITNYIKSWFIPIDIFGKQLPA